MEDWKEILKNRKFDWRRLAAALGEISRSKVRELATELRQTGTLILHNPDPILRARRDQFVGEIREVVAATANDSLNDFDKEIKYVTDVEQGYAAILTTLESQELSATDPSLQIWAAMLLACDSITRLEKKVLEKFKAQSEDGLRLPFSTVSIDRGGESTEQNIDALFAVYATVLHNTLLMLAWKNKWFRKNRIVIPLRPEASIAFMESGPNSYLASEWMAYAEADEHVRFFGGKLDLSRQLIEETAGTSEIDVLYFQAKLHTRMFETIARERLESRLLDWQLSFLQDGEDDLQIAPTTADRVELTPAQYLTRDEYLAKRALADIFFMELDEDVKSVHLSIREVLRGYASLKQMASTNESGSFIKLHRADLVERLKLHGLREKSATLFIDAATAGKGRRDLYDAPLIEDASGDLWFFAPLLKSAALIHVVTSQAVYLGKEVGRKGTHAEVALHQIFRAVGLPVSEIKYTEGGVEYQCDAAVLWENHLFIFEVKNRLLPLGTSVEYSWRFWEQLRDDSQQCRRISDQLAARPDLIKLHFGEDACVEEVHSVLLQVLPFSLPGAPFGSHVYDLSALGRFFLNPDIIISESEPREGQKSSRIEHLVGSLWQHEDPEPEDFLRELKQPLQIRVSRKSERWSIREQSMRLSNDVGAIVPTLVRTPEEPSDVLRALDWSEEQIEKFWVFQKETSKKIWPTLKNSRNVRNQT